MSKLFVRQVKSSAGQKAPKVKTLIALGLGKIGKTNTITDNPAVRGMVRSVIQLVEVKNV